MRYDQQKVNEEYEFELGLYRGDKIAFKLFLLLWMLVCGSASASAVSPMLLCSKVTNFQLEKQKASH